MQRIAEKCYIPANKLMLKLIKEYGKDFNIAFSSPADFADLTDDWDIVQFTSVRIELIDVSGGNGGTDKLVFEKN